MTPRDSAAVAPLASAVSAGPVDVAETREAERQRELLRAIQGRGATSVTGLVPLAGRRGAAAAPDAGLAVYRANAQAHARRALAAAYPTVSQLVGDEGFAALATALWRAQPPVCGDLAWFGHGLGDWLAEAGVLSEEEAYLPDVARLEWAVHRAGFAADPAGPATGLSLLADAEPDSVGARFTPGLSVLASAWPVVTIWQAHRGDAPTSADAAGGRFDAAREALAAGRAEQALVWRRGWQVEVGTTAAAEAAFMEMLMAGSSLGQALAALADAAPAGSQPSKRPASAPSSATAFDDPATAGFSFEAWLLRALREGWLAGFELLAAPPATRSAAG